MYENKKFLFSSQFWFGALGICIFFLYWYIFVDLFKIGNFARLPGFVSTVMEWTSIQPTYGNSIFTAVYYDNIFASIQRVLLAFILATILGMTVGLLMGWSNIFRSISFPLFEILRPIPILAYVPLVLVIVPGREAPIIVLTFLAAFFVTALNTLLGVRSIDETYFRAARVLGFSELAIFKHVIIPGALPYIFVGLQIGMGACWFSLVASEIVSGQRGMGYQVWQANYYQQYEVMAMYMGTLGALGWFSCFILRRIGNYQMAWRKKMLGGI